MAWVPIGYTIPCSFIYYKTHFIDQRILLSDSLGYNRIRGDWWIIVVDIPLRKSDALIWVFEGVCRDSCNR